MGAGGSIVGVSHISLSIGELERSLAFYRGILGLPYLVEPFDGQLFDGREAILLLPSGIALCLQEHRGNPGESFDPRRTGLDHLAFQVASVEQLRAWASKLDAEGINHSGIKPLAGFGSMIELRDPDNIQIELHVPN